MGLAIELDWLDVVRTSPLCGLVFGFCGSACAVMGVVLVFRLKLCTGRIGHPMGHVRSPTPGYLVLHSADCWTIGVQGAGKYTTREYGKACSVHRLALDSWALNSVAGKLTLCGFCEGRIAREAG